MKEKKDKYRIVEHHHKFYVEKLHRFLFWEYYNPIRYYKNEYELGDIIGFDSLEEVTKYIDGLEKKYHKYKN